MKLKLYQSMRKREILTFFQKFATELKLVDLRNELTNGVFNEKYYKINKECSFCVNPNFCFNFSN